jgi:hypothetical protein
MQVYLINKLDRFHPENNVGDWIVEIWVNPEQAADRADVLDAEDQYWFHCVIPHEIRGL